MEAELSRLDPLLEGQLVRYGDYIRIWAKSPYLKGAIPGSFDPKDKNGGHLGVYEKLDRTARVLVPPVGFQAQGAFRESVFRLEDPRLSDQSLSYGEKIRYGDPVVMVDDHGYIWNRTGGGFFGGYLIPRPRGTPGEVFISFQKNGRYRESMIYGDVGVYIEVEDSRHKTSFNQRLTCYKTQSSRVLGGYVCSDGSGDDMFVQLHRHDAPSSPSHSNGLASGVGGVSSNSINGNGSGGGSARRSMAKGRSSSFRFTTVLKVDSIAVKTGDVEDVMMVGPHNNTAVTLYGVTPRSTVVLSITGGTRVELSSTTLETERHNSITVDPKSAADYPLKLNLSWQPLELTTNPTSPSTPTNSNDEKSLWFHFLVAFLKVAVVYGLVHYTFPIAIQTLRPVVHAQLTAVAPVVDKILGPDVTMSVARVVDAAFELTFPTGFDSMQDPHFISVWIALTSCFLAGLLTPSVVLRESALAASARGHGGKDDVMRKRWVLTTEWIAAERPRVVEEEATLDGTAQGAGTGTELGKEESSDVAKAIPVPVREPTCLWDVPGEDQHGVPLHPAFQRFLAGEQGDRKKAIKRWKVTTAWRAEEKLDSILDQPHPMFDVIKKNYPHSYYFTGKAGHTIYIDRPGQVSMKALKKANVKIKDLLFHFVYLTEFLWNEIDRSQEGRTISVLDLAGVGFRDMVGEVMDFVKKASAISQEHYPERSHKIYIVNSPRFFAATWSLIKPWLAEETVKKISIARTPPTEKFLKEIDADVLPTLLGGDNAVPLSESPMEIRLRNNVYRALIHHNQKCIGDDGSIVEEDLAAKIDESVDRERRPNCPFEHPDHHKKEEEATE